VALNPDTEPPPALVAFLARQLETAPTAWAKYAERDQTRRDHALELQAALGLRPFTVPEYWRLRGWLTDLAMRTHKPLALAEQLIERLRPLRMRKP
jgi:hypothetical protein